MKHIVNKISLLLLLLLMLLCGTSAALVEANKHELAVTQKKPKPSRTVRASPHITGISPDSGAPGKTVAVVITGTHLDRSPDGLRRTAVAIDGAGIRILPPDERATVPWISPDTIRLRLEIGPFAPLGPRHLSVGAPSIRVVGSVDSFTSATFTVALAAPSDLTASTISPLRIDLHWRYDSSLAESLQNVEGFKIERLGGPPSGIPWWWSEVGTVGINARAYSDRGTIDVYDRGRPLPNGRYWYRVRAYFRSVVSAPSNEVRVETPDFDAPPWNLQAVWNSNSGRVDLSWQYFPDWAVAIGIQCTSSDSRDAGPGPWGECGVSDRNANATTYSHRPDLRERQYYFRVRALLQSPFQGSSWSKTSNVVTVFIPR